MISHSISDPKNGNILKVNGEGEASVVVHPHPPLDEAVTSFPYRQYFTDDGLSTGSSDMQVNGTAAAPIEFWITADITKDVFIKTVSIVIGDAGAVLNLFGAIAALTNGIEFSHVTNDNGTIVLHDAMKTNLDFVRMGLGQPSFGTGTSAFRADLSGGGADSYLPVIDFSLTFGLPWGVKLRKGTKDKIVFIIKDDTRGVDQFDAIGYGIKI